MKAVSRRRPSRCTNHPSLETLEARMLLSAFVSTTGVGNWSSLSTWATQDGGAVTHIPGSGDTVTINGKVTVDVVTTVGTGTGDAIKLGSSANMGDKTLTVAAPLTVQGSILSQGKSVLNVLAGQGIEFDAAAGVQPMMHAPYGSQVNLYLRGTAESHSYMRTKPGSAGQPGIIVPDSYYIVTNIGATYTDFTDLNGGPNASAFPGNQWTAYGLIVQPNSEAQMTSLDHCTFTRTTLYVSGAVDFTLSNSYFSEGLKVPYGDIASEARFVGTSSVGVNLINDGFDKGVSISNMKTLNGCVFENCPYSSPYLGPAFQTWTNNIVNISDASNGYLVLSNGINYSRTYVTCTIPNASNPHISEMIANQTFDHMIIDTPLAADVDDGIMILNAMNPGSTNDVIQNCLSLPRIGGTNAGSGTSLGFLAGLETIDRHNTMAVGRCDATNVSHTYGGNTGGVAEFKNNIGYTLDSVAAGGWMINQYNTYDPFYDVVLGPNCDNNALYRLATGGLAGGAYNYMHSAANGALPGAHDLVNVNPNFIDPTRNLTTYYRTHSGIAPGTVANDVPAAVNWIRQHPDLISDMINWVYTGYIPTNIAYKAASDNVAPSNGWIGAMEGKPVGDANLDGKTNFQDYILLERNFGQTNVGWEGGDFNTDGVVNFQDYILLERNFGTSYVSAAPTPDVATPIELAANITPVTATDLPVSTPVVGPVAPAYLLNGTATAGMASTLFSGDAPMALPTMSGTGPSLRTVTWPKAQKWQVPPVKGAIDAMTIDLLGALAM